MGNPYEKMDSIDYLNMMGATVTDTEIKNTGFNFTTREVNKYYKILRTYALSRYTWQSNIISQRELRLIEWHIFHKGYCAMIKPKIRKKGVTLYADKPLIYPCNVTKYSIRSGEPLQISIMHQDNQYIDPIYDEGEFVLISDDFLHYTQTTPFCLIAWEYANKLYELDLAFNANNHKARLPMIFNPNYNKDKGLSQKGIKLSELLRSAFGRNEQFVEIPGNMVGTTGLLHEPNNTQTHVIEYLDAQKKLYTSYLEMLGIYTNTEKGGSYEVKEVQQNGDQSGDYITQQAMDNRLLCARDCARVFNIDLTINAQI